MPILTDGRPELTYSPAEVDEICGDALTSLEDLAVLQAPVTTARDCFAQFAGSRKECRKELNELEKITQQYLPGNVVAPPTAKTHAGSRRAKAKYCPGDRVQIVGMTATPFHGALGEVIDEITFDDGTSSRIQIKLDAGEHMMFMRPSRTAHYKPQTETSPLLADSGARDDVHKEEPSKSSPLLADSGACDNCTQEGNLQTITAACRFGCL